MEQQDWVQLIVMVPAVLTAFGAAVSFTLQWRTKRREEHKQLSALYVNPFLLACEELQSRIYNILESGGLGALRAQDPETHSYAKETLYLIAQYFGWERHIFRFGPYAQDTEVFLRTEAIRATFATNRVGGSAATPGPRERVRGRGGGTSDRNPEAFCFFRYQQKALAQFILQSCQGPAGLEAETIPYLEFERRFGKLDSLPSVKTTIETLREAESVSKLDVLVRGRLAEVQYHLVRLLAYLEKKEKFELFPGKRETAVRQQVWKEWAREKPWHAALRDEDKTVAESSATVRQPTGESLKPKVVVFDVHETLLDLAALDPHFEQAFGDRTARQDWFTQVLQSALALTVRERYAYFSDVGEAALEMTADRRGDFLSNSERDSILDGMRSLPPHPEVPESLARLRAAGIKIAALTNSTEEFAADQLTNAGLIECFDRVLSADAVLRFKPAIETYRMAARELGVAASDLLLVAAHDWDVAGALRAGWAAAFVARPGMVLDPLSPRPGIEGQDLCEVVDQILGE